MARVTPLSLSVLIIALTEASNVPWMAALITDDLRLGFFLVFRLRHRVTSRCDTGSLCLRSFVTRL